MGKVVGIGMRLALGGLALAGASAASAAPRDTVRVEDVRAELGFLAGDALRGRGSATADEGVAAAYVASQFAALGLQPAPGRQGFVDTIRLVRLRANGEPVLTVAGEPVAGAGVLAASGDDVGGRIAVATDAQALPASDVVVLTVKVPDSLGPLVRAAQAKGIRLLLVRESRVTRERLAHGNGARLPTRLQGEAPRSAGLSLVILPGTAIDALAKRSGETAMLTVPTIKEIVTTSNAVGYLPGTDPNASAILLSAHLDHLGVRNDGVVMHGANDDASGTVAVIELARALSRGKRPRRGVLFVAYGSEEIGGFGSRAFAKAPPVPLDRIAANIEFEMVGAQDPKLPRDTLMMTGYERSNLGDALRRGGALVARDPYPEQNFFERSDNYSLALAGVVAHTLSGWATVPTYHSPDDTIASIDLPFMTRAIGSLVAPLRRLANGGFTPKWNAGGRPTE